MLLNQKGLLRASLFDSFLFSMMFTTIKERTPLHTSLPGNLATV